MSHIGYKKIQNGYIVKLEILGINNENRSGIKPENAPFAKYRCERARVLDIYHMKNKETKKEGYGVYTTTFCYKLGEIIEVKNYDKNVEIICSTGIHYFLSEECAYYYYYDYVDSMNNEVYKNWHDNGVLECKGYCINGYKCGEWKGWYENGILKYHGIYIIGYKIGEWQEGHSNGKIRCKENYKDHKLDGERKIWNNNGKLVSHAFYKDGRLDGGKKIWNNNGKLVSHVFYKDGIKFNKKYGFAEN